MTTVYAIHKPSPEKLAEVTAQMREMGAPKLEVVACGDHFMALEGSHRLAAAQALGIVPEFVVHEQDDMLEISRFDWYEPMNWDRTEYTAGEVAGELYSPHAEPYHFEAAPC